MATIDELLNASNEVATCTVNPDTREIIVPEKYKILGVFSDEKVTKIPFTCPKVVGNNVDLTEYKLYINYQNAIGRHNAYLVDDVKVSGDNITFSWLLSRDVTLSSGVVKYSLCAKKLNGDSISNEWNTTIANGVVIQGLEVTQAIIAENSDIIEEILSKAHTHANKSVLDKFAETDGKPTYDGKDLGSGASTSEGVSYTNAQLPNAANVKTALDELVPKSHSHANKDALDKISVSNGKLQYNGSNVGLKGDKGTDGTTPHIGDNGNWYLGDTDTGKPSRGEQGPGAEIYYVDLAGNYPSYTCATAMADIASAYASGKELKCRFAMGMYTAVLPLFMPKPSANTWIFSGAGALSEMGFHAQTLTIAIVNGTVQASDTLLASMDDIPTIPTALKNPNALTIKIGSTTVTYDGSAAKTVEIADGSEVSY